jgi:hypothetical protein
LKHLFLALALAVAPASAWAHELAKGPNGGPVVDTAGHHLEMVAKGPELVLFLTGADDQPVASAGTRNARAVVQDAGKTATVPLQAAEPNKLVGTLVQPLGPGARVVVSVTLPNGKGLQARFVNN